MVLPEFSSVTRCLLPVALIASVGCYAYLPPPSGRSIVGDDIQLMLTDSGTVVLAPLVGPSIGTIEGRLAVDTAGTYVVSLTKVARRDGADIDWRGERVAIAHTLVATVGARQFSRGRTFLFGALATGALVGIAEAFVGGGGATVPGGTPTGLPGGK
jgi:hypothetical protein